MQEGCSLQELLHHIDQEKKGDSPIDQLWHEREAFGSVLCSLDIEDNLVFEVIQERINQLKKEKSAALELHTIAIDDMQYEISLADLLLCNLACIKASFEEAIAQEQMDEQELDNVHELANRIVRTNKLLEAAGVEQQLTDDSIETSFQDIVEAVAAQTAEYEMDEEDDEEDQIEE